MDKKIKNFLKNKKIQYKVVKEDEFYNFFDKNEDCLEIGIVNSNRDYVFALDNKKVIGCAILFNQENSIRMPIKNTTTLSNIYVNKEYRNRGIAKNLINTLLDKIKIEDKILKRTAPDFDGKLYIFDYITKTSTSKNVKTIPHNLDFIYFEISRNNQYNNLNEEQKIDKVYQLSDKMLQHKTFKEWGIEDIQEINNSFINELKDVMLTDQHKLKNKKIKP